MATGARGHRLSASSSTHPVDRIIAGSADPVRVSRLLDQLREAHPDLDDRLEPDRSRRALIAALAASRAFGRLLEADADAMDVFAHLDTPATQPMDDIGSLKHWKQREILRIASRDLLGLDDLEGTGAALAGLARAVIHTTHSMVGADGLAVIGMGKLGGDELNYWSDVDVLFVGDGPHEEAERAARDILSLAGRCYRIDADLRPEGQSGPLVRTIDSYEAYWDRWAEPWEFQALLKAGPGGGDAALGRRFVDTAQRWLWNRPFDADDLRKLRDMKERTEGEVARRGLSTREIKRGPGGIRDIEFTAQLLQLVHGQLDPQLRSPTTLTTLTELARAGYMDEGDAGDLADAYRFLREVEHRLQLVDEHQTHTLPAATDERDHIARVLGFRPTPNASALEQFDARVSTTQHRVRAIHERVYFRPLLEAFAGTEGELTPAAAETRLGAFGFTDAKRTKAAVRELTRGLNRSSRLMRQFLPLMLDWLSASPDPDLGLLMLRNLMAGSAQLQLVDAFRDSPDTARRLCQVLGTSRMLGDTLGRNPDLVARLPYQDRLATRPLDELFASAVTAALWRSGIDEQQEALRRWKERHLLGIAGRDILYEEPVGQVGGDLTRLAEATLDAALTAIEPNLPMAVVALGRFGGAELSYASDLDVIFVYDGDGPDDFEEADRCAKAMLRFVNGAAPAERIFEIDAKLRPEGKQGAMARSIDGFVQYFDRWAAVWERQAYLRARPVAGEMNLGRRLVDRLAPAVWEPGLSRDDEREIRRMKARIEHERLPVTEDPRYHLKLGRGSLSDIEWTAQLLQLRFGVRSPGSIEALRALADAGHLATDDMTTLVDTYEFLECTRNRLCLVQSQAGDSLPGQPEALTWLARSLGTTSADLREQYRRATRRARKIVERVFYDAD